MNTQWKLAKMLGLAGAVAAMVTGAGAQEKAAWNWGGDAQVRVGLMNSPQAPAGAKFNKAVQIKVGVGATGTLADGKLDWGVRLGTTPSAVERHLTLSGGNLSGSNMIGIDKAYLNFKPTKRVNIIAGKFANPFTSGGAIFDPDLTTEGVAVGVDVYKGTGFLKDVKNTLAWLPVAELATKTADPMFIADQVTMKLGKVPVAIAWYAGMGMKNAGLAKDNMNILDLVTGYEWMIKKFPIGLSGEIFGNLSQKNNALGWELKLSMPKVLTGSAAFTYRNVQSAATYAPMADNELGSGAGYKAFRLMWQRSVWKDLGLKVQLNHSDGYKGTTNKSHNSLLVDLGTKF